MQTLLFSNQNNFFDNNSKTLLKNILKGKKIAYIPSISTSSRKYFHYSYNFYSNFEIDDLIYTDIDKKYNESVPEIISNCDAIHLSGGNTFYFWKNIIKRDFIKLFTPLSENEKLIIGESAGAIIITKSIRIALVLDELDQETKKEFELLNKKDNTDYLNKGLNLVDFEFAPHYNLFKNKINEYKTNNDIYYCEDNGFVYVNNDTIKTFGNVYFKKGLYYGTNI